MAKTGADADALSTSFMIMDEADIQKFVKNNSDFGGIVVDEKGSVLMIGNWD
jgi:thiamine biosynthesis lipoprotein ApbE